MFEVLVFVYENYWCGDECPEPRQLERKLNAAGFDAEEIHMAIDWLNGLNQIAQNTHWLADAMDTVQLSAPTGLKAGDSLRVYSEAEQTQLGSEGQGFVMFLESAGVLPSTLREVVIERAMAVSAPISLDDLKIIVLMVYWRFGEEPDALILDELSGAELGRLAH
ncbi:MAG: DUF494 family protein [Hylemonella sp.]